MALRARRASRGRRPGRGGFDGFIQSGTCASPSDDVHVKLKSDGPHDVVPYEAKLEGGDETTVLGYYGSPQAPGFGLRAIYTDEEFSLVITDTDSDEPVACGDILQPDADQIPRGRRHRVQLLPVGDAASRAWRRSSVRECSARTMSRRLACASCCRPMRSR